MTLGQCQRFVHWGIDAAIIMIIVISAWTFQLMPMPSYCSCLIMNPTAATNTLVTVTQACTWRSLLPQGCVREHLYCHKMFFTVKLVCSWRYSLPQRRCADDLALNVQMTLLSKVCINNLIFTVVRVYTWRCQIFLHGFIVSHKGDIRITYFVICTHLKDIFLEVLFSAAGEYPWHYSGVKGLYSSRHYSLLCFFLSKRMTQ